MHRQLYTLVRTGHRREPEDAADGGADPLAIGLSGKFLRSFRDGNWTTFPNPTIVGPDQIDGAETPRVAWSHPLHDRPTDAGFWLQDPLSLDALFKPLAASAIKSTMPIFVRDIGIEVPSGHLTAASSTPTNRPSSSKERLGGHRRHLLCKDGIVFASCGHQLIQGQWQKARSQLAAGDIVAGKNSTAPRRAGRNSPGPPAGLLKGLRGFRNWTPTQRDEIDGLAGQIITHSDVRPLAPKESRRLPVRLGQRPHHDGPAKWRSGNPRCLK